MTNRAMKDSGVEWIEEVPENWKVTKISRVTTCLDSKRIPIDRGERKKGPFPYWGAGSITDYVHDYLFDEEIILLGEDGAPFFDKSRNVAHLITEKVWVNNHIHVLKGRENVVNNFLVHFLNIVDYGIYVNGSVLNKLTQTNMKKIAVALPSYEEQQKIAAFLDEKVDHIDNIIEETKKSIENLKAYKHSLITETVTKGLNPNVDMKDSGIEWAGEIPSHWRVNRLKRIFEIKKDIANQLGYDILSVTQKGLKIKDISSNEGQLSADYSKYQIVEENDFVMNHMDLLTGWVDLSKFVGVTSPDYRVFKSSKPDSINNLFYKYIFQLGYSNKIFYGLGQGVSNKGRWRLPTDQFLNFEIPIPPIEEQQAIAIFLNEKTSHVNLLIEQKEQLINELESYKKSFIYEYVTGKKEVK